MQHRVSNRNYEMQVVPGVLEVVSTVRKIRMFPLASDFRKEPSSTADSPKIRLGYVVANDAYAQDLSKGKVYRRIDDETVSITIPFSRFAGVTCAYTYGQDFPFIQVNKFYHLTGRVTFGNVHATGWLMRDLCNIHLLLNGYCLLHGAGLQNGNANVILLGLSNTGKTTTCLDFVQRGLCKLFGDDLLVTDGEKLYPCPFTNTNVAPNKLPTMPKRGFHWAAQNIPFYENFGPAGTIPLCDFIGADNIAAQAPASDLIFLKRASVNKTRRASQAEAVSLLKSSNRTEFTFVNSPIFSAYDYLIGTDHVGQSMQNENQIFSDLATRVNAMIVEGSVEYFRDVVYALISKDK